MYEFPKVTGVHTGIIYFRKKKKMLGASFIDHITYHIWVRTNVYMAAKKSEAE